MPWNRPRVAPSNSRTSSERQGPSTHTRRESVWFRCHPCDPCSGCFRSVRTTSGGTMAGSKPPEHGYRGSHGTNTDKQNGHEGDPMALCLGIALVLLHQTVEHLRNAKDLRRTRGENPCGFGVIRVIRVPAVFDRSAPLAAVPWQDRNRQNTDTADHTEPTRISRTVGASTILVAHPEKIRVVFV